MLYLAFFRISAQEGCSWGATPRLDSGEPILGEISRSRAVGGGRDPGLPPAPGGEIGRAIGPAAGPEGSGDPGVAGRAIGMVVGPEGIGDPGVVSVGRGDGPGGVAEAGGMGRGVGRRGAPGAGPGSM